MMAKQDVGREKGIPAPVRQLSGREREVATIVYAEGRATANEVLAKLSAPLTNSAVRTMLARLVAKGVLARHGGGKGRSQQCVYVPALIDSDVRRMAIMRLANEHFEGSLLNLAITVADLLEDRRPATVGPIPASASPIIPKYQFFPSVTNAGR